MFKLYGLYFNKNVIIEPTLYNKYTLTKFLFIYYGGPNDTGSHKLIYLNTLSPADGTIWEGLGCQSSSCSLLETGILLLCHVYDRMTCLWASGDSLASISHLVIGEIGLSVTWALGIWTQNAQLHGKNFPLWVVS